MTGMAVLVLLLMFVLEWLALVTLIIVKGRWLSVSEVASAGVSGTFREIRKQMSVWFFVLLGAMVVTMGLILVVAKCGDNHARPANGASIRSSVPTG